MRDRWGREITDLRLSVTDRCSCRCRYCMPAEGAPRTGELTAEAYLELAAAAVRCGIRKIRLTGGEPLVREDLPEICRGLRAIPGLEELCLTTNGLGLESLAPALRAAGVDRLNISLDTLRRERDAAMPRREPPGDLLAGIRAAEDAGFAGLKINMVLVGGFNEDEIGDFLELTRDHPWEVRFLELMPMGPCAAWPRSCFLPVSSVLERAPELEEVSGRGVARRFRLPGGAGTVGLIAPLSRAFCGGCSRIRVTADGHLKSCLHSREEIPLAGLRGEALEAAIRRGIREKPRTHHLTERSSDTPRSMNQIGG